MRHIMSQQPDGQSLKTSPPKTSYGYLFLDYILKVFLPAGMVVLLANLIFGLFGPDTPRDAIRKAFWVHNYRRALDLCKQQIGEDFFNLVYHRTYLICSEKLNSRGNQNENRPHTHARTMQEYTEYSQNSDPNIADIGYYGLGYYYSIRDKFSDALAAFEKVGNRNLKFLNNSMGHAYLETGDLQKAEEFLQREIAHNGYLEGAYSNLARVYYRQKDFDSLNRLVSDERIRDYVPGRICRFMDLKNKRFGRYITEVFSIDYLTVSGFTAAIFVLLIWFHYLRKLDVFEPERIKWLLCALVLGMAFSMLCGFLYDLFDFGFDISLKGGICDDLLYCIGGIGLIEEAVKIIPFLLMLRFSRQVNESIDYIIYAAVCALGFAFMENLMYFQDPGLPSILSRTLWSAMGHMSWTAIAAYGLFYAKYRKENRQAIFYFVFAFIMACILHGLYDFFLIAEGLPKAAVKLSLCILLVGIVLFSNMIKNALNQSEFNSEKQKQIEGLSKHLVYALSGVVVLQYLLVAWKLGIANANFLILLSVVFSYIPLIVIFGCLGKMEVHKGEWVLLFERKKKQKESGQSA